MIDGGTGDDMLEGGAGNDTFKFRDGWGSDSDGLGTDHVTDLSGSDTLDFSAVESSLTFTFKVTGIAVDDGTNYLKDVTGIEKVIGGKGNDTFVFENGAGFTGRLTAARGTNTLDYSAYSGDVTVNLVAGTATGTAAYSQYQERHGRHRERLVYWRRQRQRVHRQCGQRLL